MRILVVSEEAAIAGELGDLLAGEHGCVVPAIGRIEQAADLATSYKPDAVFVVLPQDFDVFRGVISEIRDVTSARIVGVGPTDDAQAILRVQREGGFHFVDQDHLESDVTAALKRLRSEPQPVTERGRLISVVSSSGGSGASTVAANIAPALCKDEKTCALLDMNLQSGDLASLLHLDPPNSIADFCQNLTRMDQSMFEKCLCPHTSGVRLLTRPAAISEIAHVTSKGIRKAVAMSRLTFPYVVVDVGSAYDEKNIQILSQSDVILLVMRLDFSSLEQARRLLDYYEEKGVARSKAKIVVNRSRRVADLKPRTIEETLGASLFQVIPDSPKLVGTANNRGIPVVLERPRSSVSRRLRKMADNVNGAM